MTKANKIIKLILLLSSMLFIISVFQKGRLPDKKDILPQLYQVPVIAKTYEEPFEVERKGLTYSIKPLHSYRLYGLLVAYHNNVRFIDYYHRQWGDFLNIKDICVIWGDNLKDLDYKKVRFKTGSFTWEAHASCDVWRNFKSHCLSYNHLLVGNEKVAVMVKKAKRGDQIYMQGYLAEYSHSGGEFSRQSSTSLYDKGLKSCETVYVTDFRILKSEEDIWLKVYNVAKYSIIGCLICSVIIWFKTPVNIYKA
ncbi:MAG: hypothetical protein JW869_01895 [Candidatus Omnitrophica bacterium]|nr:hypothetical protein [Candidatus Omnitrophota bacterium]